MFVYKCICTESYFKRKSKLLVKFEVALRTDNAYRLDDFVVCFSVIWEAVGH